MITTRYYCSLLSPNQLYCMTLSRPQWVWSGRGVTYWDQWRIVAGWATYTMANNEVLIQERCRIELILGIGTRWLRELWNRERRRGVWVCVCLREHEVLTLAGYSRSHPPHLPRGRCLCWLIHSHWLACSLRDRKSRGREREMTDIKSKKKRERKRKKN